MVTELARLPGVSFEAPPPRRRETLPRMDIAAFAGFAATGPLHVPVAIESPRRFRDLFGDDPRLAWDAERGEVRTGHLGRAVEAFFANGGRRCWIVRVADDMPGSPLARHEFEIPGLIHAADRAASPPAYVRARARAAGSWCEGLAAGAALLRDPLPLSAGAASLTLDVGAYRIDFAAGAARLAPGDLVEITFGPGAPVLLLFAARVTTIAGGLRLESGGVDAFGETEGAYWILPASPGSPAFNIDPETQPPEPLTEAAGRALALAVLLGSPAARPVARRLSFELLVFNGKELHASLGDLTFCSRHPRYWGSLPTDEELFRARPGERVALEPSGLARDAAAPRFPLAGPLPAVSPPAIRYDLPWGMGRTRTADAARALPIEATANTDAIERDGLAAFGPALFLDPHLGRLYTGALLAEGEHRLYVAQIPLKGVHTLLPIEEVSLVAVPDAAHRGWDRELPPQPLPLGAPILDPIAEPDAAGRYPAAWSAVDGADSYQLQQDTDPAFPSPVVVFDGAEQATAIVLPDACPRDLFFRVRAARGGEVGPWSNTRAARLPREDFALCEQVRPPALVLEFSGASPGPALTWTTEDPAEGLPAEWDLMEATDAGFANEQPADLDGVTPGLAPLPARRFSPRYYRVRGVAGGVPGVWSNTVFVPATERANYTEVSARSFEAGALLAIHRALLRFAAARGDFLALLSLPDFHRAHDAIAHAALLTPGGSEEEPAPAIGPLRVPPLTEGESTVLSFGALYHPWAIARTAGQNPDVLQPLRLSPPDGAIAGQMAAVAANEGAWIAPANRPLNGVLALQPAIDVEVWRRLVAARVNALLHDARGFLARSEDTLGGERALGRVHVRRLMILLRRLALREGERFVFEPHSRELRLRIRHTFERLLDQLFRRGAFDGADAAAAFRVVTDDTVNPAAAVDRGRLLVELRVAPAAALAFLTVRLIAGGPSGLAIEEF